MSHHNRHSMQARMAPEATLDENHIGPHWMPLRPHQAAAREPICDKCGEKHNHLRPYNKGRYCLCCLAQLKFP